MPNVDGKSLTPDEAMLLGRCPECGAPLIPRTARSHAESHWGADPGSPNLATEGRRRFNLVLDFAKPQPRLEGGEKFHHQGGDASKRTYVSENGKHSAATEFIAAILLEAVATPFWEVGTRALFEGAYLRMVVAWGIGSVPAIAGLLTVANYWPQLRTSAGSWLVNHMEALTADLRWWFAILVFLFLGVSWPRFIRLLHEKELAQQPTVGDADSTAESTQSKSRIDRLQQQLAQANAQIAVLQSQPPRSAISPTPVQLTGPISWNGSFSFSQTTDANGGLLLLAIIFDGKNTSSIPIQLTNAYIISELTGEKETLQVSMGPGQLASIGEINQIPPGAPIELWATLKPGLHAAAFLERWGKLRLHAEYGNNRQYDRIFDQKTVTEYLNQFPFANLGPHITKKPPQ